MDADALVDKLRGADRRSTGRSEEVVSDVLAEPALFGALVDAMTAPDAVVRMRAADAAEKVTRRRPDVLAPHKARLLDEMAAVNQQEVRWHVAQMLPRLALTAA
ncbi:MAG TPA: ACT domain-containing protein, partial [Actinomycetes bacterium]|nr:ACT domain-containing protein [Actinomycetes bacterium]